MGDVLTRIAYGEHFFQHHGAKGVKFSADGIEFIGWAFTQFWLVDVISVRKLFRWSLCLFKRN